MINFVGNGPNGRAYFLGLSQGNIDRLTAGRPIKVNLADMGGPHVEVVLLFGETERALFDELKAIGTIPEGVEYREAKPGESVVVRFNQEDDR